MAKWLKKNRPGAFEKHIRQEEIWVTKDGAKIPVGAMDEHHAKNCLRMLLRGFREGRYIVNQEVPTSSMAEEAFIASIKMMHEDHQWGDF